jgi:hypothetical protein
MPTIPYRLKDGKRIKGTTTIIGDNLGWNKEQLKNWAWKQGMDGKNYRETTQRACDAGTIAHYLIEADLRGIKPDMEQYKGIPDLVEMAVFAYEQSYLPWKNMVKFTPMEMEIHLVSEIYEYGATPDLIALVNERLALFDWKTSGGVYPEMVIQMAAYENAWNENNPTNPITDGAYMLRIDKQTASFHFHHWIDLSKPWEVFLSLLKISNLKDDLKRMV